MSAQTEGVCASFFNQPVAEPDLRPQRRELMGRSGLPQIVVRLGYAPAPARPTPRRALEDVVLWPGKAG